jgi:hypothetical protein
VCFSAKKKEAEMKTRKEEYIQRMTRDLKEWSATIDEYEADASRMEVVFQEDFARTIRDLREKRDLLASRLREMEGPTGDAWIALRTGVKKAAHDLAEVFAHAGEVMKKAS